MVPLQKLVVHNNSYTAPIVELSREDPDQKMNCQQVWTSLYPTLSIRWWASVFRKPTHPIQKNSFFQLTATLSRRQISSKVSPQRHSLRHVNHLDCCGSARVGPMLRMAKGFWSAAASFTKEKALKTCECQ